MVIRNVFKCIQIYDVWGRKGMVVSAAVAGESVVTGQVARQVLASGRGVVAEAGVGGAGAGPGGALEAALLLQVVAAAGRRQKVLTGSVLPRELVGAAADGAHRNAVHHRVAGTQRRAVAAVAAAHPMVGRSGRHSSRKYSHCSQSKKDVHFYSPTRSDLITAILPERRATKRQARCEFIFAVLSIVETLVVGFISCWTLNGADSDGYL